MSIKLPVTNGGHNLVCKLYFANIGVILLTISVESVTEPPLINLVKSNCNNSLMFQYNQPAALIIRKANSRETGRGGCNG